MTRSLLCAAMLLGTSAACGPARNVDARSTAGAATAPTPSAGTPPRLPGSTVGGYARADTAATRELAESLAAYERRRAARSR